MGTRADFYVRLKKVKLKAEHWLGSIAWDGDPGGLEIKGPACTRAEWDALLAKLVKRDDWTPREQGWPWPWESGRLTDFSYVFVDGADRIEVYDFAAVYDFDARESKGAKKAFPDMTAIQKVKLGGIQSGLIILGGEDPS